jgi:hypothetical protein
VGRGGWSGGARRGGEGEAREHESMRQAGQQAGRQAAKPEEIKVVQGSRG